MDLRDDAQPGEPVAPTVPGYTLGARLGHGGGGSVWAATRETDGAPVAVKVVTVGIGDQADAAVRELGVLARVAVEGLVRFHEAVSLPGEERRVALVLDRVGGGSLEGVVRARGHLSVGESVTVLAPVARALAGLHAAGVLHGDVTPANILLERSGRPLLADLGVARFVGEVPGEAVGTEGFVAPEVVDGGAVTPAADVYAAGALAWWCVTGQVPGPASWRPALESLAPGVPAAWRETTTQALLSDPAARPTAAELALAWFDSAPCEPLRLVVGSDETSLLTHRLRRPAVEVEEPPPLTRRERWVGAARGPRRPRDPAPWSGARGRAALAAGGLVVVLLVGALMAAGMLPAPEWLTGRSEGGRPPVAQSSPDSAAGDHMDPSATSLPTRARQEDATRVQREVRAPSDDVAGLMEELAGLRARAMVSGRATDLATLDAPASPALNQDTADLARVRGAGLAYADVRLTVRSARTVTATERAATVEAVVDTAAYRVVSRTDATTTVSREKAVRGQPLRFELVWAGGRWLVRSVEPASRGSG